MTEYTIGDKVKSIIKDKIFPNFTHRMDLGTYALLGVGAALGVDGFTSGRYKVGIFGLAVAGVSIFYKPIYSKLVAKEAAAELQVQLAEDRIKNLEEQINLAMTTINLGDKN